MAYPKWLYHSVLPARIVNDPAEEGSLGPDWAESPSAFTEPVVEEVKPKAPKKSK